MSSRASQGPDSDPVRVRLLGENLIAFRDHLRHRRPRRQLLPPTVAPASSSAAMRSPAFDAFTTAGSSTSAANCVDMPSEARRVQFQGQGKAHCLPVRRAQRRHLDLHGPPARSSRPCRTSSPTCAPTASTPSPPSSASATGLQGPRGATSTPPTSASCTSAAPTPTPSSPAPSTTTPSTSVHPRYNVKEMDYGVMYAAYRPAEEGLLLLALRPVPAALLHDDPHPVASDSRSASAPGSPVDDEHTMFLGPSAHPRPARPAIRRTDRNGRVPRRQRRPDGVPGPTPNDWHGRWRLAANSTNDYKIDREAPEQERDIHRHHRHPPAGPGRHREHGAAISDRTPRAPRHKRNSMIIKSRRRRAINAARSLQEGRPPLPASTTPRSTRSAPATW